jgi:hypothetical protein
MQSFSLFSIFQLLQPMTKAKVGARGCHVILHYLNTLQNQVLGQAFNDNVKSKVIDITIN